MNLHVTSPILEFVIGPIFLDVLGLQIETETIELDITAIAVEGNLLGNLLWAVASLLDPLMIGNLTLRNTYLFRDVV